MVLTQTFQSFAEALAEYFNNMEPIQIIVQANSAAKMHIGYAEVQFSRFINITPEKIKNGEFFLYDGALVVKNMSALVHGGRQPLNSASTISGPHVVVRVSLGR